MSEVASLVTAARDAGARPRLHPNGFIQLDLGDGRRLHVFPDPKPTAQATAHPIHDHAFTFESEVLLGRLYNLTYDYSGGHLLGHWRLHQAERLEGSEDTVLRPLDGTGLVARARIEEVAAGARYTFPAKVLHETVPIFWTATLLRKTGEEPAYRPRIAIPQGVRPDNAFRRETRPAEELWAYVDRVLEMLA